jgi:hypothetical protein
MCSSAWFTQVAVRPRNHVHAEYSGRSIESGTEQQYFGIHEKS